MEDGSQRLFVFPVRLTDGLAKALACSLLPGLASRGCHRRSLPRTIRSVGLVGIIPTPGLSRMVIGVLRVV